MALAFAVHTTGLAVAIALLLPAIGSARAADITVFTSGAPAAVQKSLVAHFMQASGHRVEITAATIDVIMKKLSDGAKPDVIVLPRQALDQISKSGRLRSMDTVDLARVGVGVVVREGAQVPDVSTAEALRSALLNAKSVVYPDPAGGGYAGVQIARMLERLGIAEVVRPKAVYMFAFAGGIDAVAKGNVEIGLFNISEIVSVEGARLAGPLPASLQSFITFAGAVNDGSTVAAAATAYLRYLASSQTLATWRNSGLEPLGSP